jgi:phosphatidylglycerophosphate synthase
MATDTMPARMAARARLAGASGAGCLIVAWAGFMAGALFPVGPAYPFKAVACFAALMAIALRLAGDHPFSRLGPANQITIVRAMLVGLTAALLGEPATSALASAAIVAAAVTSVLDGVDGWVARRSGMASRFGARFDVETDALLIMALAGLVWYHEKAGAWVLLCGLMRYAFVAGGWLLPWLAGPLTPTRRGRVVAVSQVVGLTVALLPVVTPPASALVALATLAALIWSFAIDVGRLWRQRAGESEGRSPSDS